MRPSRLGMLFSVLLFSTSALFAVNDGYVVKADGATLYTDWGSASGIRIGDRFSVYREGSELKHPVTGEVLGHVPETVAQGEITAVEAKFSVATLLSSTSSVHAGDRTHASAVQASTASFSTDLSAPSIAALPEVWRSDPLSGPVVGLTLARLLGNGHAQIVLATSDAITVYDIVEGRLEALASFHHRLYRQWLAVDSADLTHQGRDDIFATAWFPSAARPHVVVLRWQDGALKAVADQDGFARSVDRADGSRTLVWQTLSRNREKHFSAPEQWTADRGVFKPGADLPGVTLRDDQLFGFTFGDWGHDQKEDVALLEGGDKLRVHFATSTWNSGTMQGGSKNEFVVDSNVTQTFPLPLRTWHTLSGVSELITPHNIPELGLRLFQMSFFKSAEITGWSRQAGGLVTDWQISLPGYLVDYSLGNVLGSSSSQLVAAMTNSDKTILLAYRLP